MSDELCQTLTTFLDITNVQKTMIQNALNNQTFTKFGYPPYLGCELEVVFKSDKNVTSCLLELWTIAGIHLSYDSSISNGFEIITNPMDFDNTMQFWKKVIPILKKYNAFCDGSCGFHLHIEKTPEIESKVKKKFSLHSFFLIEDKHLL